MRAWVQRAVIDVLAVVLIGAVVLIALFAYHGQEAYVFLQQLQAQQRAASAPAK